MRVHSNLSAYMHLILTCGWSWNYWFSSQFLQRCGLHPIMFSISSPDGKSSIFIDKLPPPGTCCMDMHGLQLHHGDYVLYMKDGNELLGRMDQRIGVPMRNVSSVRFVPLDYFLVYTYTIYSGESIMLD